MSTSADTSPRWTEVTITVGTERFDGVIDPRHNTVYVRLKSLTDHLRVNYEGQYYKLTHDNRYKEVVHVRDGKVRAEHVFLRQRSRQGQELRDHLYLPLPLIQQYLADLNPDRIRNAEGRAFAWTHKETLVDSFRRGFEKQRTAAASSGGNGSTIPDLETLIRQHFDQAQAIVQRVVEERRQQAERERQEQARQEQEQRQRERQEREQREQTRRRQEQQRRRENQDRGRHASPPPEPWWTILGVSAKATRFEVERCYRELSRIHHPDRGGDITQMMALNRAIEEARQSLGG